jgi:hypothetical protein
LHTGGTTPPAPQIVIFRTSLLRQGTTPARSAERPRQHSHTVTDHRICSRTTPALGPDVRHACTCLCPKLACGKPEPRSYGLHGHDGVPDSDLVTFLQPLGCLDAAPVQPGAVGRAQVFDIPPAAGNLEACVAAGGEFVVDDEAAFPAHGELGIEGAAAVGGLDAQGPGTHPHSTGDFPLPRDGGRRRPPGRLFLRTDIFPRRQRRGMGSAVGLIGVSC